MIVNGWEYMTKTAAVLPFSPNSPVYVDGMLSTLYYRTREAGLIEKVFCGDNPNHDQFIRMFDLSKKVLQIMCEVKDAGTEAERTIPVGFCWTEFPRGVDGARAAFCGFAFFKRSRQMRALGMLGLAYWFRGLKIDVLHGIILKSNTNALAYAHKLGFIDTATVPDYLFHQGKLVPACAVIR